VPPSELRHPGYGREKAVRQTRTAEAPSGLTQGQALRRNNRNLLRGGRRGEEVADVVALDIDIGEQPRGQVALGGGRDDHDDLLALVLGTLGDLEAGPDGGAGADADGDAVELDDLLGDRAGLVFLHLDDLVDDLGVEHGGDEAGADALELVRAGGTAGEDGRTGGLDGDDLHAGLAGLQHLADAGDGAAGADAGNHEVNLTVGVVPDFLGGRLAVDLGIVGVGELLEDDAVGDLLVKFLGLGDGALHALRSFGEDEFGAENLEELAALKGHRLGHGEDELEAVGGGDEGQGDASVTGGGLDERGALIDAAGLEGLDDHGVADAVLHAGERIEELELEEHLGDRAVGGGGAVEADEGRIADGFGDVVVDTSHGGGWVKKTVQDAIDGKKGKCEVRLRSRSPRRTGGCGAREGGRSRRA